MMSVIRQVILAIVMLLALGGVVAAAVVGDRVALRGSHPAGVPLHKEPQGTHDASGWPMGLWPR